MFVSMLASAQLWSRLGWDGGGADHLTPTMEIRVHNRWIIGDILSQKISDHFNYCRYFRGQRPKHVEAHTLPIIHLIPMC